VLYVKGLENRTATAEVFTILGQIVLQQDLHAPLHLRQLKKGVYYLRIKDQHGNEIETRRIIKS
jgi:hypothetical protein